MSFNHLENLMRAVVV